MSYQVEEILTRLNILLPTLLTELTLHLRTAVQAILLRSVFLVTHARGLVGKGNGSSNSKKYIVEDRQLPESLYLNYPVQISIQHETLPRRPAVRRCLLTQG